jgi:hypothetical protein
MKLGKDWEIPQALSHLGFAAAEIIRLQAVLQGQTYTGGCKVFYSPAEWRARGESYGCNSELIVVFDGSDVRRLAEFNNAVDIALGREDLFIECCTHWYAAVYKT